MDVISTFLLITVQVVSMVQSIDHCEPNTHFSPPKENQAFSLSNHTSELLSSKFEESRESCLKTCCNTDSCNIASFNTRSTKTEENCLYRCLPLKECSFQDASNVLSYVLTPANTGNSGSTLFPLDTTDSETIQKEVDTSDAPPEDEEIITEKVVDVINSTDINLDEFNNGTKTSQQTSAGTTKTINPSTSHQSSAPSSNKNSLATGTFTTNLALNGDKKPVNTNAVSQTLSLESTLFSTHVSPTTSQNTMSSVNSNSATATNISNSVSKSQPSTIINTKTSIANMSNIGNSTQGSSIHHDSTDNISQSTSTTYTTNTPPSTTTTTITPKPLITTSKIVESTSKEKTDATTYSGETSVSTQTTTVQNVTTFKNPTISIETNISTVTKDGKEKTENFKLVNVKNQTILNDVQFTSNTDEDIIVVTPASGSADLIISAIKNHTLNITEQKQNIVKVDAHVSSVVSSQIDAQEITVQNKTVYFADLNITFADSNQLLEEEKESHVLSAALIAALSFGILFFFAVLVLLGKRCFYSWQRRHYSRVDYLVNGMYN